MNNQEIDNIFNSIESALLLVSGCRVTDVPSVPLKEGTFWVIDHSKEFEQLQQLRRFIESSAA